MQQNMKLMFEHSDQAVLLLEKSTVCYANPRAQKLLGMDPTNKGIIDLADYNFVKACFSQHTGEVTHHRNVWFRHQCFHVSRTELHGFTLLFLYHRKEARFTETFLHDALLSLGSQVKELPVGREKREMETLINATLAVSDPTCVLTDLREFLAYTLSQFDVLTEQNRLTVELDDSDATVFLYAELMYLTLIWVVLDFLRMTEPSGKLTISYKREHAFARLSFQVENAVCPTELYDLLFEDVTDGLTDVLSRNGSALFRAKRVFALHDSRLEYAESEHGFTLSAGFAVVDAPPTLYSPLTRLLSTWTLNMEELRSLIRSDLEEA